MEDNALIVTVGNPHNTETNPPLELNATETYLQWRYRGATAWINLLPISTIIGEGGANAKQVELFRDSTHIGWRFVGEPASYDLATLAELKGVSIATITANTNGNLVVTYSDSSTQTVPNFFTPALDAAANSAQLSINNALLTQQYAAAVQAAAVPQGDYNAATNTPALTADSSAYTTGSYFNVTVTGNVGFAGKNFTSGTTLQVGDQLRKINSQWFRVPFAIGDKTIGYSKLDSTVTDKMQSVGNTKYVYGIKDAADKMAFGIDANGKTFLKLLDGTVVEANIDPTLVSRFGSILSNDYQYAWVLSDNNGNIGLAITKDGTVVGKFYLPAGSVTLAKLATEISSVLPTKNNTEITGYAWCVTDANDKVALGVRYDGTVVGKLVISSVDGALILSNSIADSKLISVSLAKLPADFVRLNQTNALDTTIVEPDELWRSNEVSLPVKTSVTGYGFEQFPTAKTPVLRGINTTGTAIQIRKSSKLVIRGKRYISTFSPLGTSQGLVKKGTIASTSNALPSSSGLTAGDYFEVWSLSTGSRAIGALSAKRGDLIVWNGSAFVVQAGPSDSAIVGDFWNVSAAGTYAGVSYTITDRIVLLGMESNGGAGKFPRFSLQKAGAFFLMGEFTPASFSPSDIREGDVYIAASAGTFSGITFSQNDYLLRQDGAWGQIMCEPALAVAAGAYFHTATGNANDYEVRRVDKSTTTVNVALKGIIQLAIRRTLDGIVLYSDSMGNTVTSAGNNFINGFGALIAPRVATAEAFGGASASEVLSMLQYRIRTGDIHAGKVHLFWPGRNNTSDYNQTILVALTALSLIGSKEARFCFMSVIPNRGMTYNGTRLVSAEGENSKAGTGDLVTLENWYKTALPGNCFITREQLLAIAASRTTLDPTFPGMTEAQVASTYGILPFSYHFDWSTKSFTAAQLNFLGYYGTAGLPTGGNANDYYLRSGNGTIGTLIVNVAGTWIEYDYDRTHLTAVGNADLATVFYNFFTIKNW